MSPSSPPADRAPRRLWRAALLGALMPGLGHVYCGRVRRGMLVWAVVLVGTVMATLAWARWLFVPSGPITVGAGAWVALQIVLVSDLARFVRQYGADYRLRPVNHGLSYLAIFLGLAVLPLAVTGAAVERLWVGSVHITDRAMFPQLLPGDRVLFDRGAFDGRRPTPGELVVFARPPSGHRVARVVAAGGETIHLRDARPIIDGLDPDHAPIEDMRVDRFAPDEQARLDGLAGFVEARGPDARYIVTYDRAARRGVVPDPAPVSLADDELFVLADNRDEAVATRGFGRITLDAVQGRPRYVWVSSVAGALREGRAGLELR